MTSSGFVEQQLTQEGLELRRLSERLSQLRGQQEAKRARHDFLSVMVGEAKARILRQPKVQEFLDELQERCHQKTVGVYEELLTAIVQDVMPGDKSVSMTLKTARGLPSLDIEMSKAGGEKESIIDGSGGSLANILSAGLRIIALHRSGAYPFIVLDEPDCWLKPTLFPQFAKILGQIAQDLGLQMLIITHHDAAAFDGFANIVELSRSGGKILAHQMSPMQLPASWASVETGIREVKLVDFMSHENTRLQLAPGVNVLCGENDIGKSAVVAALRAVFYGRGEDSSIAHGKARFSVECVFHDFSCVVHERHKKKSPKQRWRYYVPGQDEPVQDSSPKDGAPEWLDHVAKLARTEDLDIALSSQKTPLFLLDLPPSKRASILAVGRESTHLLNLVAKNKERNLLDSRLVRDGEQEGAALDATLKELEALDALEDALLAIRVQGEALERSISSWRSLSGKLRAYADVSELSALVAVDGWPALAAPELSSTASLESLPLYEKQQQLAELAPSLPSVELAPPSVCQTDALADSLVMFDRAARLSQFELSKEEIAIPQILGCEDLSVGLSKYRSCLALAGLQLDEAIVEQPVLMPMDSIIERGRLYSRLCKLADLGAASAMSSPDPEKPSLHLNLDGLAQKLSEFARVSTVLDGSAAKAAQIDEQERLVEAKLDALYDSVGGKCPVCESPLGKDGLMGVVHG